MASLIQCRSAYVAERLREWRAMLPEGERLTAMDKRTAERQWLRDLGAIVSAGGDVPRHAMRYLYPDRVRCRV